MDKSRLFSILLSFCLLATACGVKAPLTPVPLPSITLAATRTAAPSTPTLTSLASSTPFSSPTPLQPTQTPQPAPTEMLCLAQGGRMEISQLVIPALKQPLDYRLYLPPCYAEMVDRRYPVLYLVHGQSFTDDQWDRLGVDETLDDLIAAQEISPFLVVMPRDRMWGTAEQDEFDEGLLQGLIPYIDAHYRTLPDRGFRAIGGLSRGAGWAAHLGLARWDLFSRIGLHSLAIFWSDIPQVKQWLNDIPPDSLPRIYMDAGNNDRPEILQSAKWFEELLTQRGIAHEWHLFKGYHDEAYWGAHVEQYLRWYAEDW